MKSSSLLFFLSSIFSIVAILSISSCANIIPPGGGPKDTLPPELVMALPKDSALHFNAKKITLTFNEYVQLDNSLSTQLVVSPNPKTSPSVQSRLKQVTIELRDTLKPNTTYAINFGNALRDVNENNPLRNFIYVFSTGNQLDNGQLSGTVTLAATGGYDSTLIVVLHSNISDSAVKKIRPDYYTLIDGKGHFQFKFLPQGKYNVFVLPNDYTKMYDDSTKLFAFLNQPVNIDSNGQSVHLYAYNEFIKTETPLQRPTLKQNNKEKKDQVKVLHFSTNLQDKQQSLLEDLKIVFDLKITKFDSSKIILTDSNYQPVQNYTIAHDSSKNLFSIHLPWQEDEYFKLILQKDAFADSAGITLFKTDTISFKTRNESFYGSLRLHFTGLQVEKNPVLQFLQNQLVVDSIPLSGNLLTIPLFNPGQYNLRILFDDNKNKTWDAGSYSLKKQPEIVIQIPDKLSIRGNWDNEVEIKL